MRNEIEGANAGLRARFSEKSQIVRSRWSGVARLKRSEAIAKRMRR
jgi:hypothetical protein